MTYRAQDVEGIVDLETKSGAGEVNGDYVRLGDGEPRRFAGVLPHCCSTKCSSLWWWVRVALLCVLVCAAVVPLVIFAGPLIIRKVVVPILDWERATFSTSVLGLLLFTCIALFPSMLLPSSPCMWIAGMTFGYGYGFLLIMSASTVATNVKYGPYISGSLIGTVHEIFITIYRLV
ncbi:TVP38 TMEM64 family membrane protein [Musa troglodytarum]|uniref:TVP38 TMEM64 family membrane protein n=1 Tax=Musa troglodytarum TaxID=320322 RepID=A0A9E7FY36_9LILI|nr:TVP38 TMEM64 family membrane protein [Musa troglodytarum]